MKKKGFGQGRWNGFGGKVEPGEDIKTAAKREVKEEIDIEIETIKNNGTLTFSFEDDPKLLEVHVFTAHQFSGKPIETDEMKPEWFDINKIPYSQMWPDDIYWLPIVLEGKNIRGRFHFKNPETLISKKIIITES